MQLDELTELIFPYIHHSDPRSHARVIASAIIAAERQRPIDEDALEKARLEIEDLLVEMRDSRMGTLGRGNGFVVRERDGRESSAIRLGTREGLRMGIRTYLEHAR